jgi:DNA-binding NarL/FixJ family response regulator
MAVRLREAVLRVRAGEALFSPGVQASIARNLEHIVERVMGPLNLSPSGLTAIELDVVGLLAEGLDTEEISARLAYSVRSIKLIIRRLMDRFELKNRVAVVAFAIRIGAL